MDDAEIDRYAKRLGPQREDVKRLLATAARSDDGRRIARSVLRAKLRQADRDPDDDDPFTAVVSPEDLGGDGVVVGPLANVGGELIWRHDEVPYSALFVGAPGFGKTSTIIRLLMQLVLHYCIIVADLRGDYECLVRVVPNNRFFVFGSFPINLLRGSSRVPPAVWNQKFSEVFTDQFDLFQASRRYLNLVLDSLEAKRVETGHWPCLLDLLDAFEDRKEQRGSDELKFCNRCLARVDAVRRALGEEAVGVEEGINLEGLIEAGTMLIFRIDLEKSVQDFLVNWLLAYVFEHRLWTEDKFNQRPLVIVLDEQRSILRVRR